MSDIKQGILEFAAIILVLVASSEWTMDFIMGVIF